MLRKGVRYIIIALAIAAGIIMLNTQEEEKPASPPRDYAEILMSGKLRAVTDYNGVS